MEFSSENLTIEQSNILRLITEIIGGFSLAGSILIICTFWILKKSSFNLELLQYYAISNLFFSICAFIPYNPENRKPDTWCAVQSFFISMFQNSRFIWSSIISYTTFINCIKKNSFNKKNKYRIIFISGTYLISALLASM